MGKRSEPRLDIQIPVLHLRDHKSGSVFSRKVTTVNVSRGGIELAEIELQLAIGEIIALIYASKRGAFRVKWVGTLGTLTDGTGTIYGTRYLAFLVVNCGTNVWVLTGSEAIVQNPFDLPASNTQGINQRLDHRQN